MTLVVILTMKISIITPAFGQLNWLRMCIASVADQNQSLKQGSWKMEDGSFGGDAPAAQKIEEGTQSPISYLLSPIYLTISAIKNIFFAVRS